MTRIGIAITLFTIWVLLMYIAAAVTDGGIPPILGLVQAIMMSIGITMFIIGEAEQK